MEPSLANRQTIPQSRPVILSESDLKGKAVGPNGEYVLQHKAGKGGMGEVWIAECKDPRARRPRVAIKIIHPHRADDALLRELVRREMKMHERVRDVDGIVRLIETGTFTVPNSTTPIYFIVMDWIDGAKSLVEACKGLAWNKRIELFVRICRSLDFAHKRGVIHCDIKPHNILVDKNNNPHLADFGLAISSIPDEKGYMGFDIGSLRGTWTYMAAEQCKQNCDPYDYTPALDVHSLGVTFYEALTGELPYKKDPQTAAGRRQAEEIILTGRNVRWRCGGRTMPPPLRAALLKATDPDPSKRYQNAGELAAALETLLSSARRSDGMMVGAILVGLFAVLAWVIIPAVYSTPLHSWMRQWVYWLIPAPSEIKHVCIISYGDGSLKKWQEKLATEHAEKAKVDPDAPFDPGMWSQRALTAKVIDRVASVGGRTVAVDLFHDQRAPDRSAAQPGAPEPEKQDAQAPSPADEVFKKSCIAFCEGRFIDKTPGYSAQPATGQSLAPRGLVIAARDWRLSRGRNKLCRELAELEPFVATAKAHADPRTDLYSTELSFESVDAPPLPSFTLAAVCAHLAPDWRCVPAPIATTTLTGAGAFSSPRLDVRFSRIGSFAASDDPLLQEEFSPHPRLDIAIQNWQTMEELIKYSEQSAETEAARTTFLPTDLVSLFEAGRMPRAEVFHSPAAGAPVMIEVLDFMNLPLAAAKDFVANRIVIIADGRTISDPNGQPLDLQKVGKPSRNVFGSQVQAIAMEALLNQVDPASTTRSGATISQPNKYIEYAAITIAALAGIGVTMSLLRRRRLTPSSDSVPSPHRVFVLCTLAATLLLPLVSVAAVAAFFVIWNPVPAMCVYLLSIAGAYVAPWWTR